MTIAKLSVAKMVVRISELNDQLVAERLTTQRLREELVMTKSAPTLPHGKEIHTSYYDYVRSCRAAQRGQRVCTYKSFAQWNDS